ncbi:MAG: pyridoxal phosphate enzyme (YggS family) [Candidatus Deianiraeaceae bacterium]
MLITHLISGITKIKKKNNLLYMNQTLIQYSAISEAIPNNTRLTIVTKKHTMESISCLLEAGHKDFAENYVQEAQDKWHNALQKYPNINLKLIGRLQSNKINDALHLFDEIHSIHSLEIANKIANKLSENSRTKVFYFQVNVGLESQKSGIVIKDVMNFLKNSPLLMSGLMCIPPYGECPSPYFLLMQNIKQQADKQFNLCLKISMGMSGDFQEAIALGSDEVRIGSAILGERS